MRRTGLLDIDVKPLKTSYSDEEVWQLLQDYSGATNSTEFQAIPRPLQKHYLYLVHVALPRETGEPEGVKE